MARLPRKTPTTPVAKSGLKRKHEGTKIKGDLPAGDLLEMQSSPFQKEKHVTMQQKSEEVESTGSQCYISVKKEMQRAAEVTGSDTFEGNQEPFDVDKLPSIMRFDRFIQEWATLQEELKEVVAVVESNCDEIERMNNHYLAGRRRIEKQTEAANARLKELLKLRHR
ncbi:hypothetical protein EJB05_29079, partial [Eragrostis curvula]